MFISIHKDTTSAQLGRMLLSVPAEDPRIVKWVEENKGQEVTGPGLMNMMPLIKELVYPGRRRRWKLTEEGEKNGKPFHPSQLRPPEKAVCVTKSFPYTACGTLTYLSVYLCAQMGVEGCGCLLGEVEMKGQRYPHTVGILPPMDFWPRGTVFEVGSNFSGIDCKGLKEGEYAAVLRNEAPRVTSAGGIFHTYRLSRGSLPGMNL